MEYAARRDAVRRSCAPFPVGVDSDQYEASGSLKLCAGSTIRYVVFFARSYRLFVCGATGVVQEAFHLDPEKRLSLEQLACLPFIQEGPLGTFRLTPALSRTSFSVEGISLCIDVCYVARAFL